MTVLEKQGCDEKWADLKSSLLEVGEEVCGSHYRKVGCGKHKGSEWWNECQIGSRSEKEGI